MNESLPPVAPIYFVGRNRRGMTVGAEVDAMGIQSVVPNSEGGSTVVFDHESSYEVNEPYDELIERIELLRLDTWLEAGGPEPRRLRL